MLRNGVNVNLLPLSLLSPAMLLSIARKRSARGKKRQALRAVDKALNKLASNSSPLLNASPDTSSRVKEAWLLKGYIHKDLGEYPATMNAFLAAYELGGVDGGALDFLTSELLKAKDLSPRAQSVYLDYLSQTRYAESPGQARRNLELLEALSAPNWRQPETLRSTERWNAEIASRRGDLGWPYRNLGAISLSFDDWWRASQLLRRACALDDADYGTLQKLSYALFREGQFQEAKEHLDRLINQHSCGGAFLLRAHVLRELGDYAGAALDYRRVSESGLFTDEERMSYAEVCINTGYFKEASRQLNILSIYYDYDPRWLLMSALVDRAEKRAGDALMKFRQVIPFDEFCPQAVAQILSLLAENPAAQDALDALDNIPEYYEDDLYWTVRGNVLRGLDRIEEALDAWDQVLDPSYELCDTIISTVRHYLVSLYNAGQDLEIIDAVRTGLTSEVVSDEVVAEIIVSALSRHILSSLYVTHRSKKFLKDIDLVSEHFHSHIVQQKLDLLRGLIHVSLSNYQKALEIFLSLPPALTRNEEIALQLARCAIRVGESDTCLEALEGLRSEDARAGHIRVALAALNGDWNAAAQYLSDLQPAKDYNKFRAAIFFKAGRWTELEHLSGGARNLVNYYRIAHLLQSEDDEGARHVMSLIPADAPGKALADRLFGWFHLQKARDYKAAGEHARADKSLTDALVLWPDSNGPAAYLKNLDADLMRALLDSNSREVVGGILEARAASRGLVDPSSCHNLALFYFVNGVLNVERDDLEGAIESWEKLIAYLCVPLSNQTYMMKWASSRLESYGINPSVETTAHIEGYLLKYYEATFSRRSEQLLDRAMSAECTKISDLSLALRAELQGVRLASQLGGFSVAQHAPEKIATGPIFVSMMGWERPFALFLSQIKIKQAHLAATSEDDPMLALLDLMAKMEAEEKEGAVDVSVKEQVEKLFSIMRFAVVRQEEGNLEAALRRLREVKSAYKLMRASRARAQAKSKKAQGHINLSLRSPAFARYRSTKRFRELAATYEIELLIALGEQNIASLHDQLSSGVQYWREAVAQARDDEEYAQVVVKIREIAMGRAYFLQDKRENKEAIRLLEEVEDLCGDETLRGLLSRLYALEGILACNGEGEFASDRDRLEVASIHLRQGADLNPNSLYAQSNLARVLLFLVDNIRDEDPAQALMLLEEAMDAIYACRYLDTDNEEYREMEILTRAKINFLRIESGEIIMEDLPPEDVYGLLLLTTK